MQQNMDILYSPAHTSPWDHLHCILFFPYLFTDTTWYLSHGQTLNRSLI